MMGDDQTISRCKYFKRRTSCGAVGGMHACHQIAFATLSTQPPESEPPPGSDRVAKAVGFSLHAGVGAKAHQRDKLERLCRYISRSAEFGIYYKAVIF